MPTWNLPKKSYFLPKSCTKTKTKLLLLFTQRGISKGRCWNAFLLIFFQIKCYKILKWRLWLHRQFSRHFPGSCYPRSLVPASVTYSQLPYCGWTYTADFRSLWWPRPRPSPLSLLWKFGFTLGPLPAWCSCAELNQDERGSSWGRDCTNTHLCHGTQFLNLQKHPHHVPQESRSKHTWHYKTGRGTNLPE